jgi:hypothetical protein
MTFAHTSVIAPIALLGVTMLLESGPAGCVAELWLLKYKGDPTNDAHWIYMGKSITAGGDTFPLASFYGAQIRVRSGGTAGSAIVTATAD